MKKIQMIDTTLCGESSLTFKERLEVARQLAHLGINGIEFGEIGEKQVDFLLVRTVASFLTDSVLSVSAGIGEKSLENAMNALKGAKHPRICLKLPVSSAGMEYFCHKKPLKLLDALSADIKTIRDAGMEAEFCALDATRADEGFLQQAINVAVTSGAQCITVDDSAAELLPNELTELIHNLTVPVPLFISFSNRHGMACACAAMCLNIASGIKTTFDGSGIDLETMGSILKDCGIRYDLESDLVQTELHRVLSRIAGIPNREKETERKAFASDGTPEIVLSKEASREDVLNAVSGFGYDLTDEDAQRVYQEFIRVSEKKNVSGRDLEAIVATTALQVPSTYQLKSYVINNGNIISSSAQITLVKDGCELQGVCLGNGPVDAAFLAIEQVVGHHYELDDFQIQSVTEGREAVGHALVRLRDEGKLYSGHGVSTDILGASIRAYLNALNKIVFAGEF